MASFLGYVILNLNILIPASADCFFIFILQIIAYFLFLKEFFSITNLLIKKGHNDNCLCFQFQFIIPLGDFKTSIGRLNYINSEATYR